MWNFNFAGLCPQLSRVFERCSDTSQIALQHGIIRTVAKESRNDYPLHPNEAPVVLYLFSNW